ncbi:MAG: decarboxylase [Candidatus Woesearchaeota archaeon]
MAYFLVSKKKIIEQINSLRNYFDVISYSYKTNPFIGNLIFDMFKDIMFSIHSENELKTITDPSRVLFFLQGHTFEEINQLFVKGIKNYVIDNETDLKQFLKVLEKSNTTIETLFFRLKFKEHTFYTGKYFVYGFDWKIASELIEKFDNPKITNLGIHFHRKTQNIGEWQIKEELEEIFSYNPKILKKIKIVNIGGGIPWQYVNSKPDLSDIFNKIQSLKTFLNSMGILLMSEPGRFIAAPAVRLVATVKNVYDNTIILDCSIYNAYMDTFLLNLRLRLLNESEDGYDYLIKGCSPDSLDIFRYKVKLKKKVKPGDKIVFLDAGAYNFYTEFQQLDKIEYVITDDFQQEEGYDS